jgi:hypothetical protein
MNKDIFDEIHIERVYQDSIWGGPAHDDKNTSHDWIAYIVYYLGKAIAPWKPHVFRINMIKVAALAVAAIEWIDRANKEEILVEPTEVS